MDVVYQKDLTFFDIALPVTHISPQYDDNITLNNSISQTLPTTETCKHNNNNYASQNEINNNQKFNVTVTQTSDHMILKNANDVLDVAVVIDQVVTSRGAPKTLNDSLHTPKRQSIVNLPPNDLRHHLNALRHKPTSDQPGFLLIKANSIVGYN